MDIYGRNSALEYLKAIKSGSGGAVLFVSGTAHGKIIQILLNEASRAGVRVERREKGFFSGLGPSSVHQGIVLRLKTGAKAESKADGDLDFMDRVARDRGVLVLLDRLTDPYNVGSIIRTAEALGASGVVMLKAHAAPVTSTVVKASAGATAHIQVIETPNAARFIEKARDAGFWIIGSSGEGDTDPSGLGKLKPAVIIIGSEGDGIRRINAEKCHHIVRIPLRGRIGSLNASVAAGILLYELLKESD